MATNDTSYGEYRQEQATRRVDNEYETTVESAVDDLQRSLATGDDETFAVAASTLVELLNIDADYVYENGDLHCVSELPWHPDTLLSYLIDSERVESESRPWKQSLAETLTAIAVARGRLDAAIQTEQPAVEYETQVGTRYVRATSKARGEVELIDTSEEADLKATLLTGSQGSGKSTGVGTLVEDRIERGHAVIDLVDLFKSENGVYDVEDAHDSAMQQIRDRHGLDRGFEGDYDAPDVTVLAPLTHTLADVEVPFRETEGGEDEPVVSAFTIPASELTFRQLVMLLPHTTKTQQGYIKSAHHYLTQSGTDWSLAELATTVRTKTNAGDAVADRIERSLRTAQSKSFIRDEDDPHELDWETLMQRERHVAAFTVHMIREKSDKLAVLSYLIDKLYDVRKKLLMNHELEDTDTYPPLTVVMRELHTVAPRSKSEQDSESTIEGYMIDSLSELLALMRHANMEVIADTQKFKQQLSPDVSGLFHRVFCYSGQKPDVREVFRTRIDDTGPAERVAQYETGTCALVSSDGYTLPIQMMPPRFHHLDASTDGSGLTYRAKQLDDEYLKPAPWSAEIPSRLRFGNKFDPREGFWNRFVRDTNDGDDRVLKERLAAAAKSWFESEGYQYPGHDQFKGWLKTKKGVDECRPSINALTPEQAEWARMNDMPDRVMAFKGIRLETPPSVDPEHDPVEGASAD